ncbi:MAG TPA: hypothetical protein VMJ10_29700 [Kofleriaceae bacterium]|nr:hypothetical protein [Kofleriaceae bacterium]
MQRSLAVAVLVVMVVACSSKSASKPDAPPADAALTNQPFGAVCTVVSDMSTECASGVCTNSFNMFPTPVCSVKCTMLGSTDPVCPNGSMGQKCNMKGYCRP